MKSKVLKCMVAILLIIVLTMADVIFLGKNLMTYALENVDNATNHSNVKFAAYFKDGEEEVTQSEYEMSSTEIKLYLKVEVKNDGYLENAKITLRDSNFKIKQRENISEYVSEVKENTITLNRVTAGNSAVIEIEIEPVIEEKYSDDMLDKESILQLTGDYKDGTEENITIDAERKVTLSLSVPSDIEISLSGEVITNRVYKIQDINKRIVQIQLNSKVVDDAYPIKETSFELALPDEVENIEVITRGTYATNGEADRKLEESSYVHDEENKKLTVTIENTSKDGKISWKKDLQDSIIVTLILPENAKADTEEYSVNLKVKFQGDEEKTLEKVAKYNLKQEADGIIRAVIENKEDIYKGKIYLGEEREYSSITNLEVNYADLIEGTVLKETIIYRTEDEEKQANIEYKTTTINKSEIKKVLGDDGRLTIKDSNGTVLSEITKEVIEKDENENIVITYNSRVKELQVDRLLHPAAVAVAGLCH